jgi:DNA-binding NarL/FixJ family response regulator
VEFETGLKVTGTYGSIEDALGTEWLRSANVVVLDIGLPGMSGIEGIPEIRKKNPDAAIIMATVFEDDQNIFDALRAGAVGYLSKRVSTSELVQAVRSAHQGGSPMTPNIARKVIQSFQQSQSAADTGGLNSREREVLNLLADGKSYGGIAKQLHLSVDGVGYHIRNIYQKLQVKNRGEAVREGFRRRLIGFFR